MNNTNTTEAVVPEDTGTAPSVPIPSPSANTTGTEKAPTAQSPTADVSPVAPPVSANTTEDLSPIASPVSAPTAKESIPDAAPVSAPVTEEIMSPVSAPVSAPVAVVSPVYESPISSPASFPSRLTEPPFPTTFGGDKTAPASTSMTQEVESFVLNPFHLILIVGLTALVTLLLFWKCCKSWKLRREKHMLRLQSTRVDAVLGDMQMVGMDEYDDDDPELI